METITIPKIGDEIYVRTAIYISHGVDDVQGGLARVIAITNGTSAGRKVQFVEVAEHPGNLYNWDFLGEDQEALKERFGKIRARRDPNDRPEFNGRN